MPQKGVISSHLPWSKTDHTGCTDTVFFYAIHLKIILETSAFTCKVSNQNMAISQPPALRLKKRELSF